MNEDMIWFLTVYILKIKNNLNEEYVNETQLTMQQSKVYETLNN